MRISFPYLFASVAILMIGLANIVLLRLFNPLWWRRRWIRLTVLLMPLVGLLGVWIWSIGQNNNLDWLAGPSAGMVAGTFVLLLALLLSLPMSGLVHFVRWASDRLSARQGSGGEVSSERRRLVLKGTAAAIPLAAAALGLGGVARAFTGVRMPREEVPLVNLPASLDGLRVLQLSDMHLRHYVTLDDLEEVLRMAEGHRPDLVLVTGDIADDLAMLPDALKMIAQLRAPLGAVASLGNHEYFRGVDAVKRIFDQSPIPLFINEGIRIPVSGSNLFVAGIDDPRSMGAKDLSFFRRTIDATLVEATSDDTIILMSHRPDAFDYAAEVGVHLTLAGHTHGGQMGVLGRSVFEPVWPDRYLWGHYERNGRRLYTTCGMGHWFPFRLGCPQEAPVLELKRV